MSGNKINSFLTNRILHKITLNLKPLGEEEDLIRIMSNTKLDIY